MTPVTGYAQPTAYPQAPAAPVRAQAAAPVNPDGWSGDAANWSAKVLPSVPGAVAGYVAKNGFHGAARVGRGRSSRAGLGFGGNLIGAIKGSVIVGGVISLFTNGSRYMNGQQDFATTGTNVASDLSVAAVGGAAGALASTVGTSLLAGVLGSGFLLTLGSIGLGLAGYAVAETWLRNNPTFQRLSGQLHSTLASLSG